MRISSLQLHQQGLKAFGDQQVKISILQEQISTGKRITKPSDDPIAASRVLSLEETVSKNEQYNDNIVLAKNRLALGDTTLNSLENVYFRLKELAIQAGGPLNDPTALRSISAEVEERLKELVFLANTRDGSGKFLFAGGNNQNAPFTETTTGSVEHVVYNGDQNHRSFQISQTRQLQSDNNGSEVFLEIASDFALNQTAATANTGTASIAPARVFDTTSYIEGSYEIQFTSATTYNVVDSGGGIIVAGATYTDSQDLEFQGIRTSITGTPAAGDVFSVEKGQYRSIFETVEVFMDTLGDTDPTQRASDLDTVLHDLTAFFDNVLDVRTSVGGRVNALDGQFDDNAAYILSTQTTIATLRDTDLAEAISQLSVEQTTLEASQAVFARITSSSLFDYL